MKRQLKKQAGFGRQVLCKLLENAYGPKMRNRRLTQRRKIHSF